MFRIVFIGWMLYCFQLLANEEKLFSQWELIPQVSIITPTKIELVQSDYEVPYKEILSGFPAIHLGLATHFKTIGAFEVSGLARAGFSYKRGYYRLPSASRTVSDSDISLLWVPMSMGTKVQYSSPEFPFVRPSLSAGFGVEFIRQKCSISELNTRAWLPYYYITPMIGFFEGGDRFNGFTFGISYIDSVAVSQKVRSWSFDLSFSFFL